MKNENLRIVKKELPKLLVIGYARHGKDTVCEMLRDQFHFKFVSSSYFCAEKIVFPALKDLYGYTTVDEAYEDRHNHRAEWFNLIAGYNETNPARLAHEIMQSYDIYCGMRNAKEALACIEQDVFDLIIWVDASGRGIPKEDPASCTVDERYARYIILNNGSKADLEAEVNRLGKMLLNQN